MPSDAYSAPRALDRLGRGPLAAAELDERQQVDRVERMPDDEALRLRHAPPAARVGSRPEVDER